MSNNILISLVDSVLGQSKPTARGNRAYFCPKCKHHKPKLEINFNINEKGENPWACWVCGNFKGKKLISLFKQLEVSPEKLSELKFIIKSSPKDEINYISNKKVTLPKEFVSLINVSPNDIMAKHALLYLKGRGITQNDIIKYNIGYCETGKYSKMIIIPSYDAEGNLNYFSSRNFDKNSTLKYKNPDVSRDIIAFELFINFNLPLIICEGMFDAIAIKRNAIPLLGKNLQPSLMRKIVHSSVKHIYIALDQDAIKQSLDFCESLINEGKEVYLVELNGKDPSDMGFINFTNIIQKTQPLTFSTLVEKKLQMI